MCRATVRQVMKGAFVRELAAREDPAKVSYLSSRGHSHLRKSQEPEPLFVPILEELDMSARETTAAPGITLEVTEAIPLTSPENDEAQEDRSVSPNHSPIAAGELVFAVRVQRPSDPPSPSGEDDSEAVMAGEGLHDVAPRLLVQTHDSEYLDVESDSDEAI